MKNNIFRVILASLIFAVFSSVSFAADVVLTPFGQSPDAMMVKVVLKKLGVDARLEKLLSVPAAHTSGGSQLPICEAPPGGTCGLPQCGMGGCQMDGL